MFEDEYFGPLEVGSVNTSRRFKPGRFGFLAMAKGKAKPKRAKKKPKKAKKKPSYK